MPSTKKSFDQTFTDQKTQRRLLTNTGITVKRFWFTEVTTNTSIKTSSGISSSR
jgi:hypothetical protein